MGSRPGAGVAATRASQIIGSIFYLHHGQPAVMASKNEMSFHRRDLTQSTWRLLGQLAL